jgi:hypothetical protein
MFEKCVNKINIYEKAYFGSYASWGKFRTSSFPKEFLLKSDPKLL